MALTRENVVRTAITLLQEVGLDGLTLRRLATELGISAPTLYWHVRDKRQLLDLMAEQMVNDQRASQPPFPVDLPWDQQVAEGFRRQFRTLIAYRDGARVVAGNRPSDRAMPQIEQFLNIWVEAGFEPAEALATILTLGDFVTGAALEYQAETERQKSEAPLDREAIWKKMSAYPTLRAAAEGRMKARLENRFDSFEHGLGLFMAGIRARHAELHAARNAPRTPAAPK